MFYNLVKLVDGKAETIVDSVKKALLQYDIPLDHMAGFGSDGANVMVGKKTGVRNILFMCQKVLVFHS